MDLRLLEYFVSVAATQHMSKSAEELDISQPALSAGIKKLEAELARSFSTAADGGWS